MNDLKFRVVVAAFFVAACLGALLFAACEMPPGNTTPPEAAAKAWAESMGLHARGVNCAGMWDSDGLVPCTVSHGDDGLKLTDIRCARVGSMSSGCRLAERKP